MLVCKMPLIFFISLDTFAVVFSHTPTRVGTTAWKILSRLGLGKDLNIKRYIKLADTKTSKHKQLLHKLQRYAWYSRHTKQSFNGLIRLIENLSLITNPSYVYYFFEKIIKNPIFPSSLFYTHRLHIFHICPKTSNQPPHFRNLSSNPRYVLTILIHLF